ncbi:NADH-quinone oxidoreductase subunit L [Spongisporangium articulatum]|uniref:NADH-quinone oxidoreductase subunit L n=1 Tax=Spongisporangium articulatum TaxID=3362603 RepID=A0ABW8ANV3_9ACTN
MDYFTAANLTPTTLAGAAVLVGVCLPAVAAATGLYLGSRSRGFGSDFAVVGAFVAMVAAFVETYAVLDGGPVDSIPFLGSARTGGALLDLSLQADELSAFTSLAVTVVAFCVQLYSVAYLAGDGTPEHPTRYAGYAATVSLFTSAMLLVVHTDDLVLLLVGWELMGLASYLLVGHHSEREAARAAAVKAFLTTRVGDVGLLLAVVVLFAGAGTTSIGGLTAAIAQGDVGHGTLLAAALLALAGVAGKSAQFPLHTWLPDAMEGPTPISALIHAATMVAAGVYLVIRLLPVYLAVPGALQVAAVIAAITMVGAAGAAFAQDDLKRLLAYSTISQVAYMLAGVAMTAGDPAGAQAGLFHLLSHAAFKALLFLAAGCVVHLVGSTLLADMGGLWHTHRSLAVLFGLGLAALAGVPPLSGFWSKEAVLTAAEGAAHDGLWTGWLVLLAGLATALLTGLYAGRAWTMVALGEPVLPGAPVRGDAETEKPHQALEPGADEELVEETGHAHRLPRRMTFPLYLLAVPTVGLGLVLLHPPALLDGLGVDVITGYTGSVLAIAGLGWALSAPRLGTVDIADTLPADLRGLLRDGLRVEAAQRALVVRPVQALARWVQVGDRDVVDAYVRATPVVVAIGGRTLRRFSTGLATGYLVWVAVGAVLAGIAGVVLS